MRPEVVGLAGSGATFGSAITALTVAITSARGQNPLLWADGVMGVFAVGTAVTVTVLLLRHRRTRWRTYGLTEDGRLSEDFVEFLNQPEERLEEPPS